MNKSEKSLTKVEILIRDLKNDPNWKTIMSEELQDAIRVYEVMGARWDSLDAFENQNYHDIALAIDEEMRSEARAKGWIK